MVEILVGARGEALSGGIGEAESLLQGMPATLASTVFSLDPGVLWFAYKGMQVRRARSTCKWMIDVVPPRSHPDAADMTVRSHIRWFAPTLSSQRQRRVAHPQL